jgi:hypothetical protein
MALMPTERMAPPPGASPLMRMTASWSGSKRTYRVYKSVAYLCGVARSLRIAPVSAARQMAHRPIQRGHRR